MCLCRACHEAFHRAIKPNWSRPDFYNIGQTITLIRRYLEIDDEVQNNVPLRIERAYKKCVAAGFTKKAILHCANTMKAVAKKA